jgi:Tol biopolymer transport system component
MDPVFAPDGNSVAFVRIVGEATSDVYTVPVSGGASQQLTFDKTFVNGLTWTADGKKIVFSSRRDGSQALWVVPVEGGEPARLPFGGAKASRPAIARRGNRLAYTEGEIHPNLWVIERSPNSDKLFGGAQPFLSSSAYNSSPQFSRDGRKITFASGRTGHIELWTCDATNCNDPQQLTFLKSSSGTPRWSPDGTRIVFESRPHGHSQIFVVNAGGGMPIALTDGNAEDKVASWSSNGRFLYFSSNRANGSQIWKMSASGGQTSQVTKHGGYAAFESSDGTFLYYVKEDQPGIWRMPVDGGDEVKILPQPVDWGNWALFDQGIFFMDGSGARPAIEFLDFATRKVIQIADVDSLPPGGDPGFAVSPDTKRIVFSRVDTSAVDIILVENFR